MASPVGSLSCSVVLGKSLYYLGFDHLMCKIGMQYEQQDRVYVKAKWGNERVLI